MRGPEWMNAVIADFARGAGIGRLSLNAAGSAALRFANGFSLRFEYTGAELAVSMTFALGAGNAALRRLMSLAGSASARRGIALRAGVLQKSGQAIVAVRIPERDVTLPVLNASFNALWRAAEETGGVS